MLRFWVLGASFLRFWCFMLRSSFRAFRFWNYSAPKCSKVSYTLWKMDEHVHVVCLVPPTIKWFHSCREMPEHFGALVNVTGRNWICQKQENRIYQKLKFQVQFWAVHQLQPAQKPYQERTVQDALQHRPESNQSQDHQLPLQPWLSAKREMQSHTADALFASLATYRTSGLLGSDLDILCLCFVLFFC